MKQTSLSKLLILLHVRKLEYPGPDVRGYITSEMCERLQHQQLEDVRRRMLKVVFVKYIFNYIFDILTAVFIIFQVGSAISVYGRFSNH